MKKIVKFLKNYSIYNTEMPGSFGVIYKYADGKKEVNWYYCREELQKYCSNKTRFFFKVESEKEINNVIDFIHCIEKIIHVPVKERAKLYHTDKSDILYVSCGHFWKTQVKKSLLTILLRAGVDYDKRINNWKSIIRNDEYLSQTRNAINRFLLGHTQINYKPSLTADYEDYNNYNEDYNNYNNHYHFPGWQDFFSGTSKKNINLLLK